VGCFLKRHSTLSRASRLRFDFPSLLIRLSLRMGRDLVVIQVVIFEMSAPVFDQEVVNRLFPSFPKVEGSIRVGEIAF
jgi:hypothetical protein